MDLLLKSPGGANLNPGIKDPLSIRDLRMIVWLNNWQTEGCAQKGRWSQIDPNKRVEPRQVVSKSILSMQK